MMHLCYFVTIALTAFYVKAQSVTDSTTSAGITDKPDGLPKVDWDILRIDLPSRENLCQRQIAYCANNCGGPNVVSKNFCNATSMAWGCSCSGTSSDFPTFLWPVVQAECSGKAQECQMICNKDTVHPSTCAALCNAYYQCGTDKAPPSYLQTENPTDIPSYDGPKVNPVNPSIQQSTTTTSGSLQKYPVNHYYLLISLVMLMKLLF